MRHVRAALPLLAGLALFQAPAARAAFPIYVTSTAKVPYTSVVFVDKTSAPELVLFSGELGVITTVAVPGGRLPSTAIVLGPGITGIGLSSGLKYVMIGAAAQARQLPLPGSMVVQGEFVVIPPLSVWPVTRGVITVPVQTIITFSANGKIQQIAAPPVGLASWWQAEGSGADVLGANHGLVSGSETVAFIPGKTGQAFSFGDQGFVEVPSSPRLESATVTAAAWVRGTGPGSFKYVLSKGASGCDGASYALQTGLSGGLQFYVFDGTTITPSPDAGTGLWDGNWHFVAGTFDGNAVRLYVDGAEVGSGTPASTAINYNLPTNDSFYIGAYRGTCELRFNGDIDDVRIFGRALAPIEVLSIYNASKP